MLSTECLMLKRRRRDLQFLQGWPLCILYNTSFVNVAKLTIVDCPWLGRGHTILLLLACRCLTESELGELGLGWILVTLLLFHLLLLRLDLTSRFLILLDIWCGLLLRRLLIFFTEVLVGELHESV